MVNTILDGDPVRVRDMERLADYTVMDDVFMRVVFRDNLPLAQSTLRTITGIQDLEVVSEETQRDLRRVGGAKSCVLDVYCVGPDGTQYDMEVQTGGRLEPLRFRYYGSAMDVDLLESGKDYAELPDRWVVVVLGEDPDGAGRARRSYRYVEDSDGTAWGDGTRFLYANASYRGDDELGSLMADFCQPDPNKILDPLLRERVKYLKRDSEGVREMRSASEEIFNEGLELGVRQGEQNNLLNNVRSMVRNLKMSAQQAMDALDVPKDDQQRYLAML